MQEFSSFTRKLGMAHWILLLAITTPGICQSTNGDICNPEQGTNPAYGIVGQTNLTSPPKKSWRPLPVSEPDKKHPTNFIHHRDYLVLVYDAEKHQTAFYDYDTHTDEYSVVPNNGAFLPVIYTKEKFLVRVCNLHPTDTVSIAGNSFTLPEQGADIRGTTLTSVPALAPTLDTLGSASAAGSPFSPAGLNFGSSAPLTSIPISKFTFGAANKDTGYTDAVINVSPEALALETVSLIRDAQDVVYTTKELNRGDERTQGDELEGSIASLQKQANDLLAKLEDSQHKSRAPGNGDPAANLGWFNQRLAETQQFVTELNGLANGVSQAGFGTRAVAIRQNFESILGVLKQIHQVIEDDKEINKSEWAPAAPPNTDPKSAPAASKKADPPPASTDACQTSQAPLDKPGQPPVAKDACQAVQPVPAQPKSDPQKHKPDGATAPKYICSQIHDMLVHDTFTIKQSIPADTFTCRAYEQYVMETFLDRFNQKMDQILSEIATAQAPDIAIRSQIAFPAKLKKDAIDKAAASAAITDSAVKTALVKLNEAAAKQTHATLLKADADQAVLDLQKVETAVKDDKTQVSKLKRELGKAKASEEEANADNTLQSNISALEEKLPQPAQDIQAISSDAKLSAALTADTARVISADPANKSTQIETDAEKNATQASTDEKKTEDLATKQATQEPQPATDRTIPQTQPDKKQSESKAPANTNGTDNKSDKQKQDEADKAKKEQATKALQTALDKVTKKQEDDEGKLTAALKKAQDADAAYERENTKANDLLQEAITSYDDARKKADDAGDDAKQAAKDLDPSAPPDSSGATPPGPEEAKSISQQWRKAAEDIETYVTYLRIRFPKPDQNGEQVKAKYGEELAQEEVLRTYYEILKMRSDLTGLDQQVSKIFKDLNDDYRDIHVEQTDALPPFTGNAIERISINVQRNYTPFTITGGATVGGATVAPSTSGSPSSGGGSGSGGGGGKGGSGGGQSAGGGGGGGIGGGATGGQGNNATAASPSSGSPSGSNDVTVLMEVHHRATFNMVGGVMAIFVPTNSYSVVSEVANYANVGTPKAPVYQAPESCNNGTVSNFVYTGTGTPTTASYYCIQATQTGSVQLAGMAGLEWFIHPRDYFPRGRGVGTTPQNWIPSLLVASSVTSLGSAFFGPNIEPVNGFNVFAGVASAHQQTLPTGTSLTSVYQGNGSSSTAPSFTPATHEKWGFSVGVGFDLSVFTQLFTKTSGPQLP